MATIDQVPPGTRPEFRSGGNSEGSAVLNAVLARAYTLNWEILFYVVIFVLAVFTRFVNLGDRVMSHDESLHTKFSYDLYKIGNFKHTPLMHGPVLFHMTALSYFLFGDSDFSARIYPAVLGVIMVLMPWLLFRRWLGKFGAMAASVLILISPMLLFHHRYIREDTPAIFFSMLMAYAVFAYIDGARPRQARWLVLLAAATLLNLASKETAFMYILIFAAFIGLFLLIQMIQGWRQGLHSRAVGWTTLGVVVVPTIGIAATLLLAALDIRSGLPPVLEIGSLQISNDVLTLLATVLLGVPLAIAMGAVLLLVYVVARALLRVDAIFGLALLAVVAATGITYFATERETIVLAGGLGLAAVLVVLWLVFARGLLTFLSRHGNSFYKLTLAGIIIGTVASLVMTNALSIVPPEGVRRSQEVWSNYESARATAEANNQPAPQAPTDIHPNTLLGRLILWSSALVLVLALAVIGLAALRFYRLPRLPWIDIFWIAAVALAVFFLLIFVEERSRLVPNVSSEVVPVRPIENKWIFGPWVIAILAVAGIAWLRFRTTFWQEMSRYAAFDVIIVLGAMILPWAAALPIFLAGYQLDKNTYATNEINAMILGVVPFVLVSVAAGLAWRPDVFLLCAGVFYGLFAFFYTSVFTNAEGVATGLVGSLGYWLAQQGVRRGSQPQYYYMLIQMPIYEYLALIGSAFAGVTGIAILWRFRATRYQAALANKPKRDAEAPIDPNQAEFPAAYEYNVGAADVPAMPASETTSMSDAPDAVPEDSLSPGYDTSAAETQIGVNRETVLLEQLRQPDAEATHDDAVLSAVPDDAAETDEPRKRRGEIAEDEILRRPLFLPFVGFWGLMITFALTLAGEKMPWLTTHITLPLLLVTGWYIGLQLEKINWATFWRQGWAVVALVPVVIVGLANVVGPLFLGNPIFGGLQRQDQLSTFAWFGFFILAALAFYALWRLWRQLGTGQTLRISIVGLFVLLGVLTARHAWMATYINYDNASEFMVYAHAAPANKTIVNYLEDLSRRSTQGMSINIAYDNEFSWPGSWYMRMFPGADYKQDMSDAYVGNIDNFIARYAAVIVGDGNLSKIESRLGDRYYRFDMIRLWWPMQEYFNLNLRRVDDAFADREMRQGLWDIWWNRDYAAYNRAYARMTGDQNTKFTLDKWPVSDRLAFFVRKDVAAQVWDFGIGSARVSGLPEDPFRNLRCDTCAAEAVLGREEAVGLNAPRGVAVGPENEVYVVDSQNSRVVVFGPDGGLLRTFGSASVVNETNPTPAPGTFREPWGIDVGADGTIYVADTWNHRVQVFASDGTPLRQWGSFERFTPESPSSPGGFYGPRDIAVDAQGRVYVADTGNKRVRVYDPNGSLLLDIGREGRNPGELYEPVGLAINDRTGELFVASTWNKRIDVFTLSGQFLRSWTLQAWYATTDTTDSGNRPYIALDPGGNYLFITDPDAGRVLVYDTLGTPVLSFGRLGTAPFTDVNQFGQLGGVAMDRNGRLVLADAVGGRVLRFAQNGLPGLAIGPAVGPGILPPFAATAEATSEATSGATGESAVEPTETQRDF